MTFRLEGIKEENKDVIPGFTFHLVYRSGSAVTSLLVQYELLFDDYDREHVNQLVLLDGPDFADQTIFNADNRSYLYISEEDKGMLPVLGQYFIQGIRHISSGYDHLLFLLVLLLAATRLKEAAAIVTTFTAAHSLTLILAAARIIVLPSRWIEAVIALSIAYVALENAFARRTVPRLPLVFLFGLVHGLGFAGALAELGLPERNLVATLLSFNLGVEAGQLALVLAVFPILLRTRSRDWFPAASLILSLSAAGLALYWMIERTGWLG
ncbi:HupE/UreJ family protein [Paenibacillus sp. CC-CFT747]|nr:HupE/UreJ family protein [Paenibacillus sp. CC-CFT747]